MDGATLTDPSFMLVEWTRAVVNVDLERVQQLHQSHPDLLWSPLDKDGARIDTEYAHLIAQLERLEVLGPELGDLPAIPYMLLDHLETDDETALPLSVAQQKRTRLLTYLIKQANEQDLNTRSWGSCNNTTLHLASFLGHRQIVSQLTERGASLTITNDLGYAPKDVDQRGTSPQPAKKHERSKIPVTKKPLQSYSSAERFKQLRAIATDQSGDSGKRQNSQEDLRLQNKRQQDLSLLAKRSAVKNNPLFKKFEQPTAPSSSQQETQRRQKSLPTGNKLSVPGVDDDNKSRRNSKVINSLKSKSYVSSSVFRQGEPPSRGSSPVPSSASSSRAASPVPPVSPSLPPSNIETASPPSPATPSEDSLAPPAKVEPESPPVVDSRPETPTKLEDPTSPTEPIPAPREKDTVEPKADNDTPPSGKDHTEIDEIIDQKRLSELSVQAEGEDARRWSGSQRSHWSAGVNSWDNALGRESKELRMSLHSEADSEQEFFDSYEEWSEEGGVRVSLKPKPRRSADGNSSGDRSPLRKSMLAMEIMRNDEELLQQQETDDSDDDDTVGPSTYQKEEEDASRSDDKPSVSETPDDARSVDETSVESREPSASFSPKQRISLGAESVDTWPPPPTSPPRLNRSSIDNLDLKDIDHYELNGQNAKETTQNELPVVGENSSAQQERNHPQHQEYQREQSYHQDQEYQREQDYQQEQQYQHERVHHEQQVQHQRLSTQNPEAYGSVSVGSTSRYIAHRLPQEQQMPKEYDQFFIDRPQSVKLELPAVNTNPGQSTSAFGKLYVRVSNADDLLLPLPKLPTFVRCVVSDGQYEYMSRYEGLGQKVAFDYECIVDAQPDMIITVSLHVRPDVHVRPKTGLTKWLTPAHKQRQTLNGYVHTEDGSIGQSRFALGHMIQACNQKTYAASFDCFNSWFARSSKERQRQLRGEEDMLKVVGSLSVEMLYLPVSDPSLPIPKSLRECDLSLRIRQWHQTCWHSGYLSMRKEDSQFWERYYCRLIGSQLLAYSSEAAASSFEPLGQHDIADALRLVAASDQVIVTLVDVPDNRVFKSNTIVEQTGRGFFRVTFPDTYLDCVCDEVQESEEWVRVLKSMIGRVPLKMHFSV
ncbi:hypothetical protein BJV82DRAFT_661049 [Fennellomyces sp. T-0311]|nr:hypothetical protein BJV82DRAFT_661049 [Fennellomyces sp. T-0311]